MNRLFRKLIPLMLAFVLLVSVCPWVMAEEGQDVTILFTNDLHSHLLPAEASDGGEYGGYARLMNVIRQQRELDPNAILVDGGDFSMGSLFQTAYPTAAIELRMMGAMGFDATTFGNHEYDYLPQGLASMLHAAVASGEPVPAIVEANYLLPREGEEGYGPDAEAVREAFEEYGVAPYTILERGGVYYVILGLFGLDADACAPNSGMILQDMALTAQAVVDEAVAECLEMYGQQPVVIALSHGGTSGGQGEDYELAQAVQGLHLIVSGHTHTTLREPIEVNGTWIVSAGEYGKNLGVVKLRRASDGAVSLAGYELIPIDETVEEDLEIAALVERFKQTVEEEYLSRYGMTFDQVLTVNPYEFETVREATATQHESDLGNLFSDAYKWAVEQATGEEVAVALTATGVLRESVPLGEVTVSDIFNAASLGVGTEGELVAIYVTGADLMNVFEVDASVQPLMTSAQLFCAGVEYSFNTNRMIFNKVDYAMLRNGDGTLSEIDPDGLYRIVCGSYMAQMLGNVEATSMGLLTITPREADGTPIDMENIYDYVVRDAGGNPVKEWYAIASYLDQMGGEMDAHYAGLDGRKVVYSSLNPVRLLRNANKFTWIALAAVVVVLLIVTLIVRAVIRRVRRKKK